AKGVCHFSEPLAAIQPGGLHLFGTVADEAATRRTRSEAQNVRWVSGITDDLQVTSFPPCPKQGVVHFETDTPRVQKPWDISTASMTETEQAAARLLSCGILSVPVVVGPMSDGRASERPHQILTVRHGPQILKQPAMIGPLAYIGGKNRIANKIIEIFPAHTTDVEQPERFELGEPQ